jgi:hypothetical protein
LSALPTVQRQALSAALLLSDEIDLPQGHRVVGVAVLGALRLLAQSGPLLLAVDDIQWLHTSSRKVLSFALRRLVDEPDADPTPPSNGWQPDALLGDDASSAAARARTGNR